MRRREGPIRAQRSVALRGWCECQSACWSVSDADVDECGGHVDVLVLVQYFLHAKAVSVVLQPAIPADLVPLLRVVSQLLDVLQGVEGGAPQQAKEWTALVLCTDAEVKVGTVRAPLEGRSAGLTSCGALDGRAADDRPDSTYQQQRPSEHVGEDDGLCVVHHMHGQLRDVGEV